MRTSSLTSLALALVAVPTLIACGSVDGDDGAGDGDGDGTIDAALPIDAAGTCDPATALPTQWRPIAMVSTGAVTATAAGGVTTATVDATAGGTAGAADNPYIYVDLINGSRVDVSDVQAASSTAWHVALKRSSIKLNGGDSGPGNVQGAKVAAASLAEVTAAPATLASDDWATDDCMLNALPGGEPATVMGDWYDYDVDTHQLAPKAEVWVLKLGGGGGGAQTRKLRIVSYYGDAANPMRGAYYRLEWAPL
ncbi:MAG TPA: HmuY family protein [Kofleriaceae bacterium]|nr:HmuY family protein [Kofleriaceae bacterium]